MNRIRILDEEVANKIAAGEVVERPASVVKELVENAVDAGATRVSVELEEGGKRRIRITDNGCGMTAEEAVLALQRHATSKIVSVDDLASLKTLGFRGEALPSIASVSRLTLLTRPREALAGVRLEVEGGEIRSVEEVGAPEGTTFLVEDLFYNTPARLKFLKSPRSELGQSSDWLIRIALAHSEIAVRLLSEGVEALRSPGSPDRLETIGALYGREVARELLPVSLERGGIRIEGYVSRPTFTRPTRSGQSFFVNGRFVRSRTLSHALDDAMRSALPSGRFPFAVLLIETDPAVVDVNVHPTKAEVRFLREWEFHRAVSEAVKNAIGTEEAPLAGSFAMEALVSQDHLRRVPWTGPGASGHDTWRVPAPAAPLPPDPDDPFADPPLTATLPVAAATTAQPSLPDTQATPSLRPVAQIWSSYILAEGPTGLVIIDQHLAHERILFDRMTTWSSPPAALETQRHGEEPVGAGPRDCPAPPGLEGGHGGPPLQAVPNVSTAAGGEAMPSRPSQPAQVLTSPLTLTLSRAQAMLVEEHLEELRGLGFGIESFGRDAFVVRAVPAFVRPGQEKALLHEMLEEIGDGERERSSARGERVAAAAACRAAVKKGERLAKEEIQRLLEDLARTSNPHTCPHGCPIAVEISYQELLKRFKRV